MAQCQLQRTLSCIYMSCRCCSVTRNMPSRPAQCSMALSGFLPSVCMLPSFLPCFPFSIFSFLYYFPPSLLPSLSSSLLPPVPDQQKKTHKHKHTHTHTHTHGSPVSAGSRWLLFVPSSHLSQVFSSMISYFFKSALKISSLL